MIAASPRIGYIHEPFSLEHHPGVCFMRVPYWFLYVTEENAPELRPPLEKTLRFSYSPLAELHAARAPRHLGRLLVDGAHFLKYRLLRGRPLIKDPLALFSAEWLAAEFDMDVILLVRHPAAFAASVRRLGYRHPFSHFLQQRRLMRDHLGSFEDEIRAMDGRPRDIIEEAALLWRIITFMTLRLRAAHPEWLFFRHEDLTRDPRGGFRTIFHRLNLEFTPEIEGRIARATDSNVVGWKSRLSPEEVGALRSRVEELSSSLYPAGDW